MAPPISSPAMTYAECVFMKSWPCSESKGAMGKRTPSAGKSRARSVERSGGGGSRKTYSPRLSSSRCVARPAAMAQTAFDRQTAAAVWRSKAVWAIAAGLATHLLLDNLGEYVFLEPPPPERSTLLALLFPALGVRFPIAPFDSLQGQLFMNTHSAYVIAGELIGGAILLRAWLLRRRQSS